MKTQPRTAPTIGGMRQNARRTPYNGRTYASAMEAHFAQRLDLEQRSGIVLSWKPQVRLPLVIPDAAGGEPIQVAIYVVDFIVNYASGETHAIETKGFWKEVALLKRRVFEATWLRSNPGTRYRVVTKVAADGTVLEEEPAAAARALRIPKQKAVSAAEFRAMQGAR